MRGRFFRSTVAILIAVGVFLSCKPRRSELAGEASSAEMMLAELTNVYKAKALIKQNAATLNAAKVLDDTVSEVYYLATRSNFTDVRIFAASTLGVLAGNMNFSAKIDSDEKSSGKEIYLKALEAFSAPQRETKTCRMTGKSHSTSICSDYQTCLTALGHFSNFAKGWPQMPPPRSTRKNNELPEKKRSALDQKIAASFNQKRAALEADVRCAMVPETVDQLQYKINLSRIFHGFYRSVGYMRADRIGMTPAGYQGSSGKDIRQMGGEQDQIDDLKLHLDTLIQTAHQKFFHEKSRNHAQAESIEAFLHSLTDKPYEDLADEERKAVTQLLDQFILSNEGSYDLAVKMRFILDRLNRQNPTAWLTCVKERTQAWYRGYRDGKLQPNDPNTPPSEGAACPNLILNPELSFDLLTWFASQEMRLPFRNVWYETLQAVTRMIPRNAAGSFVKSSSGGVENIYELALIGIGNLKRETDQQNNTMLSRASFPDGKPYPKGLANKDQLIAEHLKHYHSLFYLLTQTFNKQIENSKKVSEARYIMGEKLTLEEMTLAYKQRGIKDDPGKLFKNPDDKIAQSRETFSDDEKRAARDLTEKLHAGRVGNDLSYACLDYRFGDPGSRVINTQHSHGFQPSMGCWEYLYFGTTRGLTENIINTAAAPIGIVYPVPDHIVDEYVAWAEYFAKGVGLEAWNKERPNPFYSYDFEAVEKGRFELDKLCQLKDADGQNSYRYLSNRINHWMYAQSVHEDCKEFTLAAAINIITTISLPATGMITNLLMKRIMRQAGMGVVKKAMIGAGFKWQVGAIMNNPAAMRFFLGQILRQSPAWALNTLMMGVAFTAIDHTLMASIGLREFNDSHLLQHLSMGVGIMGIIGIVNPALSRISAKVVSPLLKKGWQATAEYSAAGLTFAGEVGFFANLGKLEHVVTESARIARGLPKEADESWREKYHMNPYLHALILTAAFKVGHNPVANKPALN